jgi:hypothetical protein
MMQRGKLASMRHLVLVTLLLVLPVQILWAAGAGHCLPGSALGDHASMHHGHGHGAAEHVHDHAGTSGDAGQATGSAVDCSAFHFIVLDGPGVVVNASSATRSGPFGPLSIFFKSHIPPGPDRPRWRLAV